MNKYLFLLSAALVGCSAAACVNTQTAPESKPAAGMSQQAQSGENLFADADAKRRAAVAKFKELSAKPVSPEQRKYNDTVNSNTWKIRRESKDPAAIEKALRAAIADKKASPELRYGLMPVIVELYSAKRDWQGVLRTSQEFLNCKEPEFIASPVRNRLFAHKIFALDRLGMYEKKAEATLERLTSNMSEKEAFSVKCNVIQAYCRANLPDVAEPYIWSLLNDPSLDQKQKIAAASELVSAARCVKDMERLKAAMAVFAKYQTDKSEYAKMRLANGGHIQYNLRNYGLILKIRREIMEDTSLSTAVRVEAYRAVCGAHIMAVHSSMDPHLVIQYAEKDMLPLKDMTAEQNYRVCDELFRANRNYLRDNVKAEAAMRKVLTFPGNPQWVQVQASVKLAELLAEGKKYAEAEKLLNDALALPKMNPNDFEQLCRAKAKILSWQERCDDAVAFLRSKLDPKNQDTYRRLLPVIADTYKYFLRWDDIIKMYMEFDRPMMAAAAVEQRHPDKSKELARQVIRNEKRSDEERIEAATFFLGTDAESKGYQAKYPALFDACASKQRVRTRLNDAYFHAEYDVILYIIALYEKANIDVNYDTRLVQMQALATKNQFGKMGALAEQIASFKTKHQNKDTLIFVGRLFKNAPKMKAGDYAAFCKNYAFPAGTTQKQKSQMLFRAANTAVLAKLYDAAREIYGLYEAMFVPEPKKVYPVSFSDKPIRDLNGFLAVADKIQPQLMNRKYGGNMDFLVTDVTTGDRGSAIANADTKAKYTPCELRMICDEAGLHMLFTATDPETKKIAAGLMGAGSFEMYLAPGENQPYVCFLPNLEKGSCGIYNPSYNTRQWRQIPSSKVHHAGDTDGSPWIRTQNMFTETGYVFYMFLDWRQYYDKLPDNPADCWEFENIFWSRFGGYGWNGTKSIHGRSTWGKLSFNINPAQLRKIKKQIIFDAAQAYKKELKTSHFYHGSVDLWKNDDKMGDPAFFKAKVAPITDKLDADLMCVAPDMDDATIDRLYRETVPGWYEIRLIIADLRRKYLEEELTK